MPILDYFQSKLTHLSQTISQGIPKFKEELGQLGIWKRDIEKFKNNKLKNYEQEVTGYHKTQKKYFSAVKKAEVSQAELANFSMMSPSADKKLQKLFSSLQAQHIKSITEKSQSQVEYRSSNVRIFVELCSKFEGAFFRSSKILLKDSEFCQIAD